MLRPLSLTAAKASIAGKKKPSAVITAYNGGVMTVPGWGSVAIDLAGLQAADRIPILANHENLVASVAGSGIATVSGGKLFVAGPLTAATEAGQTILDLNADGIAFQASVGCEVVQSRSINPGDSVSINGQTLTAGPRGFTLITSAILREVSITPLGCDPSSSVAIAAKYKVQSMAKLGPIQSQQMQEDPTEGLDIVASAALTGQRLDRPGELPTDPLERERELRARDIERTNGIGRIAAAYGKPSIDVDGTRVDLEAHAIRAGWSSAETELAAMRAARPTSGPAIHVAQRGASSADHLEAALLVRAGFAGLAEETLGARVMEQSLHLHAASLADLCRMGMQLDGRQVPVRGDEVIRASFGTSTGSMPVAFGNAANKSMEKAYNDSPATWRTFCAIRPAADFKDHTSVRPYFDGGLQPVGNGGQIDSAEFGETTYTWNVDTFARLLSFGHKSVKNDDLSVLSEAGPALGRAGAREVANLVYKTLFGAGAFFSTGHKNLIAGGVGVSGVLSVDTLGKAIKNVRSQRDAQNNDLDMQPVTLLVSPDNETNGKACLDSEFIQRAADIPTGNPLRKALGMQVEPRLANTAKFPTANAAAWYVFADPINIPMIVGFLDGIQTPTIQFFDQNHQADSLNIVWRVIFSFGAAMGDFKAANKGDGVASS